MSGWQASFEAWAASFPGSMALAACMLVLGMILGWLAGDVHGYRAGYEDRAGEDEAPIIRAPVDPFAAIREAGRRARQIQQERAAAVELYPGQARDWLDGFNRLRQGTSVDPPYRSGTEEEEWEPVHVAQALALVRDDLTDSAYTQDMAERMDRFLDRLLGEHPVPWSADELWSGQ